MKLTTISGLLLGVAILMLGHGLAGTLLTLRSASEHYSELEIGLIMSAYFVGYIVGTLYCPALINRIGYIRAFTVAAALCANLILLHGLWANPWFWIAVRLIYGICIVSFYLVVESWLNDRSDNTQRGRVFAVYMVVNLSAMALGQQLLLLGDVNTLQLFTVASALLSFSLIPVALTRLPEPDKVDTPAVDLRHAFSISPLGLSGCLLAGMAGGAFWTMAPLFSHQVGHDTSITAAYMSAAIIGGAMLQWPIGHYSDQHDRRKVLRAVSLGATAFAVLSAFTGEMPMSLMLVTMFLYGGMCFAIYPLCVAHANDCASEQDRVVLSGGILMAYGVGAIFGPFTGGLAMQMLGPYSLPVFYAICWFILAIITHRQLRQARASIEENTEFSVLSRTSPVAMHISLTEHDGATKSDGTTGTDVSNRD